MHADFVGDEITGLYSMCSQSLGTEDKTGEIHYLSRRLIQSLDMRRVDEGHVM